MSTVMSVREAAAQSMPLMLLSACRRAPQRHNSPTDIACLEPSPFVQAAVDSE
jgi:hypothetical protein